MKNYKSDFPILQRKINGKPIVYLDSAAMSQKPRQVIDAVMHVYKHVNANVGRGIYTISEEATGLFEKSREKIARFINAKFPSEIIFTHNTTHAINVVAYGLSQTLKKSDAILISEMEHHSNTVVWQRVAKEKGVRLLFLRIDDQGVLTNEVVDENNKTIYKHFKEIPNLKIVSLAHVSNVLGTINPIEKIIKALRAQSSEVSIVIDGAQSVPHMLTDVQKLDCDFLAFSGYKMLGPTGAGVLYGKKNLLEKLEPFVVGSHMISSVTKKGAIWTDVPGKFEAGTAAVEGVIGLGAAVDYINAIGMENIREHERQLVAYALPRITKIAGVKVYGPRDPDLHGGVISFNIQGVHSHDVAQILNEDNICIRSGHHCAMPLHLRLEAEASARASFYIYNDESDVDKLIEGIKKVKKIFKIFL